MIVIHRDEGKQRQKHADEHVAFTRVGEIIDARWRVSRHKQLLKELNEQDEEKKMKWETSFLLTGWVRIYRVKWMIVFIIIFNI